MFKKLKIKTELKTVLNCMRDGDFASYLHHTKNVTSKMESTCRTNILILLGSNIPKLTEELERLKNIQKTLVTGLVTLHPTSEQKDLPAYTQTKETVEGNMREIQKFTDELYTMQQKHMPNIQLLINPDKEHEKQIQNLDKFLFNDEKLGLALLRLILPTLKTANDFKHFMRFILKSKKGCPLFFNQLNTGDLQDQDARILKNKWDLQDIMQGSHIFKTWGLNAQQCGLLCNTIILFLASPDKDDRSHVGSTTRGLLTYTPPVIATMFAAAQAQANKDDITIAELCLFLLRDNERRQSLLDAIQEYPELITILIELQETLKTLGRKFNSFEKKLNGKLSAFFTELQKMNNDQKQEIETPISNASMILTASAPSIPDAIQDLLDPEGSIMVAFRKENKGPSTSLSSATNSTSSLTSSSSTSSSSTSTSTPSSITNTENIMSSLQVETSANSGPKIVKPIKIIPQQQQTPPSLLAQQPSFPPNPTPLSSNNASSPPPVVSAQSPYPGHSLTMKPKEASE